MISTLNCGARVTRWHLTWMWCQRSPAALHVHRWVWVYAVEYISVNKRKKFRQQTCRNFLIDFRKLTENKLRNRNILSAEWYEPYAADSNTNSNIFITTEIRAVIFSVVEIFINPRTAGCFWLYVNGGGCKCCTPCISGTDWNFLMQFSPIDRESQANYFQ